MTESVRYLLASASINELSEDDIKLIEDHPHPEEVIQLLVQYKQATMKKEHYTLEQVAESFKLAMQIAKELKT
jgi:hypothetical protein